MATSEGAVKGMKQFYVFLACFATGLRLAGWEGSNWLDALLTGLFGLLTVIVAAYFTARFEAKFRGSDEEKGG